jgi:predicted N-formylglutamate amidohydrolase
MNELPKKLLAADEPAPVTVYNADGESPFVLVADHAGNIMPHALGHLGIAEAECERHIALDIGIAGLGRLLADALDATLIQQNYSHTIKVGRRPSGFMWALTSRYALSACYL